MATTASSMTPTRAPRDRSGLISSDIDLLRQVIRTGETFLRRHYNIGSARRSATEPEEVALSFRRRQSGCPLIGGCSLVGPAEPPEEIRSGGVEWVVVAKVQLVYQAQCRSRALHLADGDGPVEGNDRRGGDRKQLVIEGDDLRPVGLLHRQGVGMHGVDSGLQQVL